MKRTILCLLAALMVCAMFSAAAEEPQPLTASELNTHMERVRNRAMAAEPLNDPADEEARSAVRELLLARESSSSRSFAMVREATLVVRESCGAQLGFRKL